MSGGDHYGRLGATRIPSPRTTPARADLCLVDRLPADECARARTIWPDLVLAHDAVDYVPRDYRLRVDLHQAAAGAGDYWPIPLTPCM